MALEITVSPNTSFRIAWRGPAFDPGPPIIAGNAVWTVDVSNGMIYALTLRNGQTLFHDKIGSVTHFNSLSAGDGQVFVSASRQIVSYVPHNTSQSYGNIHSPLVLTTNPQTHGKYASLADSCYTRVSHLHFDD